MGRCHPDHHCQLRRPVSRSADRGRGRAGRVVGRVRARGIRRPEDPGTHPRALGPPRRPPGACRFRNLQPHPGPGILTGSSLLADPVPPGLRLRDDVSVIVLLVRAFGVRHRRHVAILLAAAVACVLAGAALFAATQHYPLTTGLYWAITTATTVGYGDVLPHNAVGRVIASAVMLTTIPLLASVFALVTGAAAAAGVRRILAMGHRFPDGAYRIVIGMNQAGPAIRSCSLPTSTRPACARRCMSSGATRPSCLSSARPGQRARSRLSSLEHRTATCWSSPCCCASWHRTCLSWPWFARRPCARRCMSSVSSRRSRPTG